MRVWTAISDPAELVRWFPSGLEFEPRVGGAVRFAGDPYTDGGSGTVLAYEPPYRFSFVWMTDELHLTLEPVDGVPSRGPHSEDTEPWEPVYRAHVAAGLPSGAEIPDIAHTG
jgi:uncharacterized protein YndB with AHSA1/START domain